MACNSYSLSEEEEYDTGNCLALNPTRSITTSHDFVLYYGDSVLYDGDNEQTNAQQLIKFIKSPYTCKSFDSYRII